MPRRMKRAGKLIPLIADPDNLRSAFLKARRGKSYSRGVRIFQADLPNHLLGMRREILRGEVTVGDYRHFTIFEPKERHICASSFRENVVHHAILNVCHPYFERKLIFDSYACRKGKGPYRAIERATAYSRKYEWFLKLDVRQFFATIHHGVVKSQLARLFKDPCLLHIFDQIIDSYADSPDRGMPLGNLTSQYFANHYLSGLDHWVKEELRIPAYVRYMDDMVLWSPDKGTLKKAHASVKAYVEDRLRVALKPEVLNRSKRGLPFLGYRLFPYRRRLTHHSRKRFIRKVQWVEAHYHQGWWDEATCQRHVLPLLAFTQHADTLALRQSLFAPR